MSIVWAGQPDILTPVLFGALALNGWLARCLISRDDAYPDPGGPRARDRDRVQTFNEIVMRHRERQDREMEFASRPGEPPRERILIALSRGARGLLDVEFVQQRSLAASLREEGRRHERAGRRERRSIPPGWPPSSRVGRPTGPEGRCMRHCAPVRIRCPAPSAWLNGTRTRSPGWRADPGPQTRRVTPVTWPR